MNITGWTIGMRASGKFTARIWSRDAKSNRQSAVILTTDGDDALFETKREARDAVRLFEHAQQSTHKE